MIDCNPIDVKSAERARERFEVKREERDEVSCWPWTADTWSGGYGRFYLDGHRYHAHRIAWVLAYGEDPGDNLVLHDCANVECVNPMHLYVGDQSDNMQDAKDWRGKDVFGGEDHPNAKLSVTDVREIRDRYDVEDVTQASLAEDYGVSDTTINHVVNEVLWTYA
ncbi:HNH endonuclease [halophilic archaeon]|nr:HNH endonuclease [halophilic archaeon]